MTLHLSESLVLQGQVNMSTQSIIKKISNYIFRFSDKIGEGNFSKVYKGYHQVTNQAVSIKIIQLSSVKSPKLQQLLFSQIQVIQSLNHPNILKCYQVLKSQHNCYIITELCNGGDLLTLVKKYGCLAQIQAHGFITHIFKGLLYLAERGIVHRDLKIANVFIHNNIAKIADFGFAKYTNNSNFKDLDIGSPLYMSPEGMIDHIYGMKTDIWAFGIIIYQLFHGKTPFCYCSTEFQLKNKVVLPLTHNSFRNDINSQIRNLIIKCLTVRFQDRPDAFALLKDQYLIRLLNQNIQQYSVTNMNLEKTNVLNSSNQFKAHQIPQNSNKIMQSVYVPTQTTYPIQSHSPQSFIKVTGPSNNFYQNSMNLSINNISPQRRINKSNTKQSNYLGFEQKQSNIKKLNFNINSRNDDNTRAQIGSPRQKSIGNIQYTNTTYLSPTPYVKTQDNQHSLSSRSINIGTDSHRLIKENENWDKSSNSSWSHQNIKRKFPKVVSSNTINNLNSNLSSNNLNERDISHSTHNKIQNSINFGHFDSLERSVHSNHSAKDFIIKPLQRSIKTIQHTENPIVSIKKFGQLIKGDRKIQASVKSTLKIDRPQMSQNQLQKLKSKSHINYQATHQLSSQSSSTQKLRFNQSNLNLQHKYNHNIQDKDEGYPIQQLKLINKRNIISTVIQFKQAVGLLHYCRLVYRFLSTLKKVRISKQLQQMRIKTFQNPDNADIYSRYLLVVLTQLIHNIKSKQIIYDGDNYKIKQVKEEKLKEVVLQYYKKYSQQINTYQNNQSNLPLQDKYTSLQWIKNYSQQLWSTLDSQILFITRNVAKNQQNQSFHNNFRNLCYFLLRIVEVNDIIMNCNRTKNYNPISKAVIQNWLAKQYYSDQDLLLTKDEYLKRLNQKNTLKRSETTDTQEKSRIEYL